MLHVTELVLDYFGRGEVIPAVVATSPFADD